MPPLARRRAFMVTTDREAHILRNNMGLAARAPWNRAAEGALQRAGTAG